MKRPTNVHKFKFAATIVGVLVIAVVGYTLWFVNHSAKVANDAYASANKSYAAKPVKKEASSTTQAQQYLTVKEWGVRLPIPTVLKTMKYAIKGANTVLLDSDDLSKLAGSSKLCGNNPGYLGGIERKTDASSIVGADFVKKIGNYYYFHIGPQQACLPLSAENESPIPANKYPSMVLQKQADDELVKELPSAQGMQLISETQQLIDYGKSGVVVKTMSDAAKLTDSSQLFKDFILSVLKKRQAGGDVCGYPFSVTVSKLYGQAYATGDISSCGGFAVLWAKVGDNWQQIAGRQDGWTCDVLNKYKVPSALVGDTCNDISSDKSIPYAQE